MSNQAPFFAQKFDTKETGQKLEQFYNECIERSLAKK